MQFTSISGALLLLGAQEAGPSPEPQRAAIEAVVRAEMAEHGMPGVALAVRREREWLLVAGYGLARVVPPTPVTRDTRFQIASLTKPVTASVILGLAAGDRLAIDDLAREHLPWLPATYAAVRIRHLLNHTSGVPRDLRADNLDDFDRAGFRERLDRAEPAFEPGSAFQYANTGYILLGFLAEAVEGEAYGSILERLVLDPLGMPSTTYVSPPSDDPLCAVGYELRDGVFHPAPYYSGGFTGGGMSSSVADLARWVEALEDGRLLREAEWKEMHSSGRLADGGEVRFDFGGEEAGYGMGWFLARRAGRPLWTHGGAVSGFAGSIHRYPEDELCVIVLANAKSAGADAVARRVADLLLE